MPYVDIWCSGSSDNNGTCIAFQIRVMCVSISTDTILLNIKDTKINIWTKVPRQLWNRGISDQNICIWSGTSWTVLD